ncbi:alpha/beta hydrolase [Aldersonia sp. NBC_00410]|uniref:alpha/beta hydrolase n=1 Tax=Aldersonia sp. NBC_00410 TaxID=2975954 RepID=UPI002255E6E7|nr:alpha/beta hydrolase [Aldersonia sp. NBC_00410]MCX5043721.1 alpha/beta hydrolase [Aldersonia sp. NBC_00410]
MRTVQLPLPLARAMARASLGTILTTRLSWAQQRALLDLVAKVVPLPPNTTVEPLVLGGRPAERVTVGTPDRATAVLHLHSGGYTTASPVTHRSFAALIARDTGSAVYLLDYRLAPEHPYPAAIDDGVAAFAGLVDDIGYAPERIAITGDSAGGGLSLATARRLLDERGIRPAALGLLSPWVDPDTVLPATRDTVLNVNWLRACARAYRGSAETTDPGYAPLHNDLSGLPPTLIQIGTTELFHPQAKRLDAKIRAAGGEVVLQEFPELWHCAQVQAVSIAAAADAVAQLATFLRARLQPVDAEPGTGDLG